MAARENQGLQIGLIVFVMLTIMLSVTTFLFFRNYQAEQQRAKDASDKEATARQKMNELEAERTAFVQYIGLTATEKKETVEETFNKDMAIGVTLGLTRLPPENQNYKKLVESYEALAKSHNAQLVAKDEDLRKAKATFDQKTMEYAAEVAKLTKDKDEKVAEYAKERADRENQIAELVKTKDKLLAEKDEKVKQFEALKAASDSDINKLKESIAKLEKTIEDIKLVNNELSGQYNTNAAPRGSIVWVNQREGTAVINLGSADNLRKRITFSVYDPGTTDVSALASAGEGSDKTRVSTPASEAVTKGSIEVINITDRHMAECRILQHSPSNPIIPGDVIYTPVWQPGQQDHFAFVGKLDVDGDGEDDSRRVKDIVQINGGAIDGEISVQTRYLVIGKLDDTGENGDSSKLLGDAKKFGIQHIKLSQFLEMMGYSAKAAEGIIAPGEGMKYPQAGELTGKFRPRDPPPRGKQGTSAFQGKAAEEARK